MPAHRVGLEGHLPHYQQQQQPGQQWQSPWRELVESSRYPHIPNEESEVVDDEVLAKLQPSFADPMHTPGRVAAAAAHQKRQETAAAAAAAAGVGPDVARKPSATTRPFYQRVWLLPIRHPLGPLGCRLTVLSTSIIALALAARIFQQEAGSGGIPAAEHAQIVVAVVIDVVAIPYLGYITVDDYTGKPLGLRPPKERIWLILLDLFFIIFKSASTALAFEALLFFNTPQTLAYLRALGAFELVGLISWAWTLPIKVLREIERLGG